MIRIPYSPLGQTGIEPVDRFVSSPIGKLAAIGFLSVAAAKAFPNKTVAPFVFGILYAVTLGLAPDIKTTGAPNG